MRKTNLRCVGVLSLLATALLWGPVAHAAATVTPLADGSPAAAAALAGALFGPNSNLTAVAGSAQYSGATSASGSFIGGGTNASGLGIDAGVVLSTGDARFVGSSAAFALDSANKDGTFTAGVGNALITNTAGGNVVFNALTAEPTFNASVLSFQIVPLFGTLTMSVVFASEDYNDLVNSGFPTDVFGVFVNGINQAFVPGTSLAISASTINCGGPTSGAANGAGAQNCGLYRDNAPFADSIDSEADGFTVVLNLSMPVLAGQVNSIAIGIADTLDTAGDSAVLVAAGSVVVVPEPRTWALMLLGLGAVAGATRRCRSNKQH